MINAILFDLDGTLVHYSQDFIAAYFTKLKKVFERLRLDAELAIKGVWAGSKAMLLNSGERLNSECFWAEVSRVMGLSHEQLKSVEAACDAFYASSEFDSVKSIMNNADMELPRRLVRGLTARGFTLVLATNPLFPECAIATRLGWVGLSLSDFQLVTHYNNSTYCKPNLGYYREILNKIGKEPRQCLMAGNSPLEDMCAGELGAETFLVNECIDNESGIDISGFRSGTLADLEAYFLK